ncbi:MAG: TIGR04282 family arsenosugar biosynthesis glycosyltransferase [Nitrospirae bacterium]|nr:TIGR04282 family arsenosugar biosynthesis glycosyltransferase [Nitrospirota bacterium]
MDNLLIIFAKAPVAGLVKTRMFPFLSFEEAAGVQRAFLEDTVDKAVSAGTHEVCIAYSPEGSHDLFRSLFGDRVAHYHAQAGDDLGARMAAAFGCAFGAGARKAVIVGSDVPTLPSEFISDAFGMLDTADVVLGPSQDGGYYLVGLTRPVPALFAHIPWSARTVFRDTLARAEGLGLSVSTLPTLRDVDTFEDLRALVGAALPPHTHRMVYSFEDRLRGGHDWLV